MIYLTQLVYVHAGREHDFERLEDTVLPLLDRHNGELLLRLRPDAASRVGGTAESPYEVHILRFEGEEDLAAYSADPQRREVLHLKEESVRDTLLIQGVAARLRV